MTKEGIMCQEIEYIAEVINKYDISISWLARQLNQNPLKSRIWTKQHLDYLLSTQKEITTKTYQEIKNYFDEHNYSLDTRVLTSIGDAVSSLNNESAQLVSTGFKAIEDNHLSSDEIEELLAKLISIDKKTSELKTFLKDKAKRNERTGKNK